MAVTEKCQGMGIGKILLTHCINAAVEMNLEKLILYSNRSLKPAIELYLKYGFKETILDPGHYERADIKMELNLKKALCRC
jgi:ribosomal protein S18 acetylase RimI-like enzyme